MKINEILKGRNLKMIAAGGAAALIVAAGTVFCLNVTQPYALTPDGEKVKEAYSLKIDGEEVALFATEEECNKVVDDIRNYYTEKDSTVENVEIKQEITVEEADLDRGFNVSHPEVDEKDAVVDYIMTGTEEKKTYTVKNGDTAWDIADNNDITVKQLSSWNDDINIDKLAIGDELDLYETQPLVDVTTVETVTYKQNIKYDVKYIKTSRLYEGQTKIKKEGEYGKKLVTATVTKENGETVDKDIISSEVTRKPVTQVVYKGTKTAGESVVAYAMKFVGNPYVWGGTSLTNGADCSGFTLAVYAHFGYSLPHNSWAQMGCGKEVPYSQAKPGDLIIYGNHVAIYAGGGMIVHAANSRQGITTGYATYRTIISVRRIIS